MYDGGWWVDRSAYVVWPNHEGCSYDCDRCDLLEIISDDEDNSLDFKCRQRICMSVNYIIAELKEQCKTNKLPVELQNLTKGQLYGRLRNIRKTMRSFCIEYWTPTQPAALFNPLTLTTSYSHPSSMNPAVFM